ncbi:hypothetical protein D1BOALGB6SA_7493 [Olavius sp. associated proteobacterium Delta 1]|nr:hypothetical protein D1BOALGB6SA_7493 [Olavius sp. associated proteobacterium Delta 1]
MVQRFPELQRIDQGLAVSILFVQSIQTFTSNQKRSNPLSIVSKPDPAQLTTPTQKERSSKNVRGLKAVGFQVPHLLP